MHGELIDHLAKAKWYTLAKRIAAKVYLWWLKNKWITLHFDWEAKLCGAIAAKPKNTCVFYIIAKQKISYFHIRRFGKVCAQILRTQRGGELHEIYYYIFKVTISINELLQLQKRYNFQLKIENWRTFPKLNIAALTQLLHKHMNLE